MRPVDTTVRSLHAPWVVLGGYGSGMGRRAGGVVLALVALGAAGGYAFGTLRGQETVTFTDATPIVAVSPSHPVD
ncbi:hypothetical protein, partial [Nocardioides sp.]|uniref:hypothetical protein n=1 Tax=Nocardioides sp. TaxID=35761 RepID=UPI0027341ECB